MHRCLLVALAIVGPAVAAAGQASAASAETASCDIWAWAESGPDGLEVRAGPGADAAVVGHLPSPISSEGYEFMPEVSITGTRDGWFRIDQAILDDYDSAEDAPIVFSGEGWIPGDRLGLLLNRGNLMAGPDVNAPIVAKLFSDAEGAGPDSFNVTGLRSCVGRWVEVEGDFLGTHLHGWNASTCSNQVTTCP